MREAARRAYPDAAIRIFEERVLVTVAQGHAVSPVEVKPVCSIEAVEPDVRSHPKPTAAIEPEEIGLRRAQGVRSGVMAYAHPVAGDLHTADPDGLTIRYPDA